MGALWEERYKSVIVESDVASDFRLERGFDMVAHRRLVVGNWVRTIGWSMRGVLAILMLASA